MNVQWKRVVLADFGATTATTISPRLFGAPWLRGALFGVAPWLLAAAPANAA